MSIGGYTRALVRIGAVSPIIPLDYHTQPLFHLHTTLTANTILKSPHPLTPVLTSHTVKSYQLLFWNFGHTTLGTITIIKQPYPQKHSQPSTASCPSPFFSCHCHQQGRSVIHSLRLVTQSFDSATHPLIHFSLQNH